MEMVFNHDVLNVLYNGLYKESTGGDYMNRIPDWNPVYDNALILEILATYNMEIFLTKEEDMYSASCHFNLDPRDIHYHVKSTDKIEAINRSVLGVMYNLFSIYDLLSQHKDYLTYNIIYRNDEYEGICIELSKYIQIVTFEYSFEASMITLNDINETLERHIKDNLFHKLSLES